MERISCDGTYEWLPRCLCAFFQSRGVPDGAFMLVAYSGGSDSTALLAAAVESGYRCRALHCNFHLRGDESDRDEAFARSMADTLGCSIEVAHFDVMARVAETGESLEMACRELRYEWFARRYAELTEAGENPACVAVAHHASDNLETFFLNLMRGSGLKGLAAISDSRGIFLRPMLNVAKRDVMAYLSGRRLSYVDDSSNASDIFRRNVVRNRVLPSLEKHLPGICGGVGQAVENLRRDSRLLEALVERVGADYVDDRGAVDVAALSAALPCADVMLFHMLEGKLAFTEIEKIMRSLGMSGRWYHGKGGVSYLLDRGKLILVGKNDVVVRPRLRVDVLSPEQFAPDRTGKAVWLDGSVTDTSESDWELRQWRHGDRMRPFGMRGSRLVSDILTDAKMSAVDKQNVWVLSYRGEIVWVVGVRCSSCFAVTPASCKVVRIAVE